MKPVRFLHIADMHLGALQHPDVYRNYMLPKLADLAKERDVTDILIAGDIFDKPEPEQYVKDCLLNHVVQNEHINYTFVAGDHDYTTKRQNSYLSLHYLQILQFILPNVTVCEPGTYTRLNSDFGLVVLPGSAKRNNSGKDIHTLKCDKFSIKKGEALVLSWHGIFPGLTYSGEMSKQAKVHATELLDNWNAQYIALGDIHRPITILNNCRYPGSLVQKTYKCQDGLLLVDIDSNGKVTAEPLQLDLPKKETVIVEFEQEDFDSEKNLETEVINLVTATVSKGNLVKIKFELPASIWSSLDLSRMQRRLLRDYAEVKFENDLVPEEKSDERMNRVREAKTVEEELEIIIKEDESDLDKKRLRETCLKHLH